MTIFYLFISIIYFIITFNAVQSNNNNLSNKYFLPKNTIPEHYELNLDIFLEPEYYFNGSVEIYFNLLESTDNIILHSRELNVNLNKSYVYENSGNPVKIVDGEFIKRNDFLSLILTKKLKPGLHILKLYFTGNYYNYAYGLFLSKYGNKVILATHFEPVQARTVFPCFDEPHLKSSFRLSVTHPEHLNAISNTDVSNEILNGNGRKTTTFEIVPKISTYLIVLAVSDYDTLECDYLGRKLHLYGPPEKKNLTEFSLNISVESLKQFEKLLKVNYSLPKLDGVVVPTFGGGMENWGLIVYGSMVIVDPNTASENSLKSTINLLCHEIAHQWFGNLVTLSWWDYVWLNEGFATYYSAINADMIFETSNKNYRFMDNHVVSLQKVLRLDSDPKNGESLNKHVDFPETIRPKFNTIGYQKGSAIVRFMSLYFSGYEKGITHYLKSHSYNNSSPNDLFRAINRYSKLPERLTVEKIMTSWVENEGYPLITINTSYSNNVIKITQERFSITADKFNETWYIPISFTQESNPDFSLNRNWSWLSDKSKQLTFDIKNNENSWLLGNLQAGIFCRINYDLGNWKKIIKALQSSKYEEIHLLNRAQLINDANVLAKLGKLSETIALDLLSYLKHEHDKVVHRAAHNIFVQYNELLKESRLYPKFKIFVNTIYNTTISDRIFNPQNIKKLVENALKDSVLDNKFGESSKEFQRLSQRLYADKDFNYIRSHIFAKGRNAASYLKLEFLDNIKKVYEYNKLIKTKFILNKNLKEVETWLSNNY